MQWIALFSMVTEATAITIAGTRRGDDAEVAEHAITHYGESGSERRTSLPSRSRRVESLDVFF